MLLHWATFSNENGTTPPHSSLISLISVAMRSYRFCTQYDFDYVVPNYYFLFVSVSLMAEIKIVTVVRLKTTSHVPDLSAFTNTVLFIFSHSHIPSHTFTLIPTLCHNCYTIIYSNIIFRDVYMFCACFSQAELRAANGKDSTNLWVALYVPEKKKTCVFDVSSRADLYGAGESYHVFVARNATRALATMDLQGPEGGAEGLDAVQLQTLGEWVGKYAEKYPIVGYLEEQSASA